MAKPRTFRVKPLIMKKIIFLLAVSLTFSQCVYDDYEPIDNTSSTTDTTGSDNGSGTNTGTGTGSNTSNKITYLGHVKPILNQLCISCHGSVDPEDDLDISTYSKAKSKIDKIIKAMDKKNGDSDVMPPSGRADENLIQTIKDWKTDGLLEGEETTTGGGNADGNITYNTDIKSLLEQDCTACHGASNPSGGLNLTTYTLAKTNINSIIARIDLQNGQTGIMPPAGRMSEAKIQAYKDWLAQGLLEN